MKKKLTFACLSLVGSISIGALASCSGSKIPHLNEVEGLYLTYNGVKYTIDETFNEYENTLESAKAYYNALSDIFVQIAVDTTALIENDVNDKVDSFYKTAKDNAATNGTSEKEEIEKAFETEGVSTEQELREKYMLEIKTTENDKTFESDKSLLTFRTDYIDNKSPYVTKHILVKVDATSSNLYDGKISEDNAYKLSNVVLGLASTTTYKNFGEVAQRLSDDSSASTYGLISAPMEVTTSFVNEYKLGLYAQDYLFNSKVTDSAMSSDKTNLVERTNMPTKENSKGILDVESVIGNVNRQSDFGTGITADTPSAYGIPVSAAIELANYASTVKSDDNKTVEEASEVNYPRNIIFNHYFNNRSISYIYLDDENSLTQQALSDGTISESKFATLNINLIQYGDYESESEKTTGVTQIGNKKILTDENGHPILVTRAGSSGDSGYEGVHFIVANFDPFESVATQVTTPKSPTDSYDYTTLFEGLTTDQEKVAAVRNDYFNLTIPSLSIDDKTIYNPSLITSITATESKYYNTLAEAVRTALKDTYGSNLEFKKYSTNKQTAVSKGAVIPENVDALVEKYIAAAILDSNFTQERSLQDSWKSYLQLVDLQQSLSNRILPNECINQFKTNTIVKGGVCDVSK